MVENSEDNKSMLELREYIREQEIKLMYMMDDLINKCQYDKVTLYHGYKLGLESIREHIDELIYGKKDQEK